MGETVSDVGTAVTSHLMNELCTELAGTGTGLNQWLSNDSSARLVMFAGHLGQVMVTEKPDIRQNISGSEREYGKYVFNVAMPEESLVEAIIDKYMPEVGGPPIENPLRTVFYRGSDGQVGIVDIPVYHSRHQSYGFKFRKTKNFNRLEPGMLFPAKTIVSQSPNVDDMGNYRYGCEANVAFLSVPQIIEDGFVASTEFLERNAFQAVKTNSVSWGSKFVALNLYGDENNYKPFPDIGERVKDHGVLMALRRIDENMALVELTPKALMEIDYVFDKRVYAVAGAVVTDVEVWHDDNSRGQRSLAGTEVQPMRYFNRLSRYYGRIVEVYNSLQSKARKYGEELVLTPAAHELVVRALARTCKERLNRTYRNAPLDDFRVDISYTYRVVPTIGNKFTGQHGDKGVIVDVLPPEEMPVDQWGRRADLILDGDSTVKRMNPGRFYEQYVNVASYHALLKLKELLPNGTGTQQQISTAWEYLYGYYATVSSAMKERIDEFVEIQASKGRLREWIADHLKAVIDDKIYLYIPVSLPEIGAQQIRNIRDSAYAPPMGPLTYRGKSGKWRTTKTSAFIGNMYFILLEKTGEDWSAVASPKTQHFGIAAKLTRADKLSTPGHKQPVRFLGEDEVRLIAAFCGGSVVAELLDQSNSPHKQRHIARTLVSVDVPSAIMNVVPESEVPQGLNRAVQFVNHQLVCSGVSTAWRIDEDVK